MPGTILSDTIPNKAGIIVHLLQMRNEDIQMEITCSLQLSTGRQ